MSKQFRSVLAVAAIGMVSMTFLAGCKSDSVITKDEEKRFKEAPKEMPPEAQKYMREHAGGAPQAGAKAP